MGYFLSLSKSGTIRLLDASEWALLLFGIILAIGIVGEIKLPEWSHLLRRFEYMVLIGVLGELLADGGIFFSSSHLQSILDSENVELRNSTSKANERTAKTEALAKGYESQIADSNARARAAEALVASANSESRKAVATVATAAARIAEAQRDAAAARKEAEHERLARAKIEESLAWRIPSKEQKRRITERLLPFSGQQFDLVTFSSEGECLNFENELYNVMLSGHWLLDPNRKWQALMNLIVGTVVHISDKAEPRIKKAAEELARSLSAEGFSATVEPVPDKDFPNLGVIEVYIGKNPITMNPILPDKR